MKNFLHKTWFALVESRIWIALGAVCMLLCSYTVAKVPINPVILMFVFVGTWFMYVVQRYVHLYEVRLSSKKDVKHALFCAASIVFVCSYLLMQPRLHVYGWMIVFSLPALLYGLVWRTKQSTFMGLRQLPGIKILMVAIVWLFVACLPWIEHQWWDQTVIVYGAMIFGYLVAIIIPFDVRDMHTDPVHMKTIAQLVGEKTALKIAQACVWCSIACCIVLFRMRAIDLTNHLLMLGILLATYIVIVASPGKKSTLFYEGVLDGTLILWGSIALANVL